MSLERKDIRAKLDAEWHELLRAVADADGLADGEWIESLILRELRARIHQASVVAAAAARVGLSGNRRESPGVPGNLRESPGIAGGLSPRPTANTQEEGAMKSQRVVVRENVVYRLPSGRLCVWTHDGLADRAEFVFCYCSLVRGEPRLDGDAFALSPRNLRILREHTTS